LRASGDGALPVRLVHKDGSEVADNVDDAEHETIGGQHRQVGSTVVALYGTARVLSWLEERDVGGGVREDELTLFQGVADRLVQVGVDLVAGVDLDVDEEDHDDDDGEDNHGVQVAGKEGRLEATGCRVQDDTPGDEECGKVQRDPGKSFNGGRPTEQKHRCHDNVGAEAEEEEGDVGSLPPPCVDDFRHRVGRRGDLLELDGNDAEKENLNGSTGRIPAGVAMFARK
jgi:hypothetical protein